MAPETVLADVVPPPSTGTPWASASTESASASGDSGSAIVEIGPNQGLLELKAKAMAGAIGIQGKRSPIRHQFVLPPGWRRSPESPSRPSLPSTVSAALASPDAGETRSTPGQLCSCRNQFATRVPPRQLQMLIPQAARHLLYGRRRPRFQPQSSVLRSDFVVGRRSFAVRSDPATIGEHGPPRFSSRSLPQESDHWGDSPGALGRVVDRRRARPVGTPGANPNLGITAGRQVRASAD